MIIEKYLDNWERFDEVSLPTKQDFYSSLNVEDVTDIDYRHAKKIFALKIFNNNILPIIIIYMCKVIHYYLQMYLKILEICVLKNMNLI